MPADHQSVSAGRPAISVIVPFAGDRNAAVLLAQAFARLVLGPGDEVLIVDNTGTPEVRSLLERGQFTVVPASAERSSYYARNVGVAHATNDWLLFCDSDCVPAPRLLDLYFSHLVEDSCGALAGAVRPASDQRGVIPDYFEFRGGLDPRRAVTRGTRPYAVTANLMVRRRAYDSIGGFCEGIRSGGDGDFSWRLTDAGWKLRYAKDAWVEHRHRDTFKALMRVRVKYGAGCAWVQRRHGDDLRPRLARGLLRSVVLAATFVARLKARPALFAILDGLANVAFNVGYMLPNRPTVDSQDRTVQGAGPGLAAVIDPRISGRNDLPALVERESPRVPLVRLESSKRPDQVHASKTRGLAMAYLEDDGYLERCRDFAWLLARRPISVLGDLRLRYAVGRDSMSQSLSVLELAPSVRRIRRSGATHVHAVVAGRGFLAEARRLSRLAGVPCSYAMCPTYASPQTDHHSQS